MKYLFYCHKDNYASANNISINGIYTYNMWKPSLLCIVPKGLMLYPFIIWWTMHYLSVFFNSYYSIFLIYDNNGCVVHRSVVTPGYFRFPFMKKNDLQIGDTWTDVKHRGKGMATFAIQEILKHYNKKDRIIWYIVEETNKNSIKAAEKAGLKYCYEGIRKNENSLRIFGHYEIHR